MISTSETYLAAQREDFLNLRKMNFEEKHNILIRNIKRHQNSLVLVSPSDVAKRDKLEDNFVNYFNLMYSYINCCITILGLDGPDDTMLLPEREDAMRIHDSVLQLMRMMLDVQHLRKHIDPMKLKKIDAMTTRRVITPIPSPVTAPTVPPTNDFVQIVDSLIASVKPHTPCSEDIGARITGREMAETAERLQYVSEGGDLDTLTAIVNIANIPNELLLLSDADMDTRSSLLSAMDVPVLSPLPKRNRPTPIHKVTPKKVDTVVVPDVTTATIKSPVNKSRKRERKQYPSTTGRKWIRTHKNPPILDSTDTSDMDTDDGTNPSTSKHKSTTVKDYMRQMADMVSDNNVGEFDTFNDDTHPPTPQSEPVTINWSSDEEVVASKTVNPPPPKKRKTSKSRILPTTITVTDKPPTITTYPTEDKMAQSQNLTKYMREGFKIKVFSHGIRAMLWCVIRDYLRDHYVDDFETWYANLERDKSINFYFNFDHILKDGIKRLHAKCKLPVDVVDSAKKMNKGTYNTIKNLIKFSPSMDWYKFALSNNGGKMNTVDYFTLVEIHDDVTHSKSH